MTTKPFGISDEQRKNVILYVLGKIGNLRLAEAKQLISYEGTESWNAFGILLNFYKPDIVWHADGETCTVSTDGSAGIGGDVRDALLNMVVDIYAKHKETLPEILDSIEKEQEKTIDDSKYIDDIIRFIGGKQDQMKLLSCWSIFKDRNGEHFEYPFDSLLDKPASQILGDDVSTVAYDGGWGESGQFDVLPTDTVLDLWKKCDTLIKESGDHHHIFIEAFHGDGKSGKATLSTGS